MEWAITGDVSIGTVDKEELCYKYVYTCIYMYIHPNPSTQSDIINPRSDMTRVLFNTVAIDAVRCMETCLKYNRARAPPSFSDKAAFTELVTWAWNTTRDPETEVYYEDVFSASFWLSYRSDQKQDSFFILHLLSDSAEEGVWRDFYLGEEVDTAQENTNGGDIEDCAILIPFLDGWSDWSCIINKV